MQQWYKEDLAYIHDVGFGDWAIASAPGILKILAEAQLQNGLIIDLGCGSGLSARAFVNAGYRFLGIDLSEEMLKIAQKRVPEADFRLGSIFDVELPSCHAVTAIGECFNYLFDDRNNRPRRLQLFDQIYQAVIPGGIFIFDVVEPGQVEPETTTQSFLEGEDWTVLVEKFEDRKREILTRRIITFRQVGDVYRREEEVHTQQLYDAEAIASELRQIGFQVCVSHHYGEYELPKARAALVARKG
ncbi:MAG: class I SAM-dependent methyltransferase [Cyanobacteria bacterium J055]|nr:MAG: class I SAM-dependent methyltransferase [Cyanobacteria bacterium J055]